MLRGRPHPAERRAEALRLLAETDLTPGEVGARIGVNPSTIRTWNVRAGRLRPPQPRRLAMGSWPAERRAALVRLLCAPGNDPGDVALALGLGRLTPDTMVAAFGSALRLPPEVLVRPDRGAATDPTTLRTHLRAHIVRQIAAFDAALSGAGPDLRGSSRVLRDLGGLKRLLDDVDRAAPRGATGEGGDGDTGADAGTDAGTDLPALRAELARRYAGFVGGRTAA